MKRILTSFVLVFGAGLAQAASYQLEFTTLDQEITGSPFFTSLANPPGVVAPGTRLADIVFDAGPGSGVIIDDPNRFVANFNEIDPAAGKFVEVNLYNYGLGTVQYNPYSAPIPGVYSGEVIDAFIPRDGQADAGFVDIPALLVADRFSIPHPVTGLPQLEGQLFFYALQAVFTPGLDQDVFRFDGFEYLGNWTLSEVGAVPLPAAAWLFGTALAGLIGFARRRTAVVA